MPKVKNAPPRDVPTDDDGYFETMTKAVFQAGFRWELVDARWPGFQAAFDGFDIERVAEYGPPDVERLLGDRAIIRNGRKIEGTVENARVLRDLVAAHGSVRAWLATTAGLTWPERKKAVSAPFKGLGPSGAYFFLWSVGEAVPPHEEEGTWTGPVPSSPP